MTLLIQRVAHRDTLAIQAQLDELLHAVGEASNEPHRRTRARRDREAPESRRDWTTDQPPVVGFLQTFASRLLGGSLTPWRGASGRHALCTLPRHTRPHSSAIQRTVARRNRWAAGRSTRQGGARRKRPEL